jgi:hypothetical protein
MNHESTVTEGNPMDKLLAKLSEQQAVLNKQHDALACSDESAAYSNTVEYVITTSSNSVVITPASDTFPHSNSPTTGPPSNSDDEARAPSADEVLRLKAELEAAKGKIARMDQELAQTRTIKHTIDQAIGNASEADFPLHHQVEECVHAAPPGTRPHFQRDNSWAAQDDARSDTSDALSAGGFNRARAIWTNGKPVFGGFQGAVPTFQVPEANSSNQFINRGFAQPFVESQMSYPGPQTSTFRADRMIPDPELLMAPSAARRSQPVGRFNNRSSNGSFPYASSNSSFDGYTPASTQYSSAAAGIGAGLGPIGNSMNMGMNTGMNIYGGYQPQPIGTPLSPHAPEFTSSGSNWKNDVSRSSSMSLQPLLKGIQAVATEGQTYLPTTEPLNYRRLLDRTVNCNWKYIVDKIVCNNDQQASIFLQQKLKVGTTEQKYDIVEAIVAQAYPLMVNRFGNFLVQRCFEHGTPEQVIKIAEAIRGNTLNLSMDAFGCHVVQKAFDSVPEDYKAIMVHELLRRIPETVIHRYACHVWQKLFELRWTESPPQIMKYVNEALRGMWHEVALGETGSLVVQNIFENCLEEDKVCILSFPKLCNVCLHLSSAPVSRRFSPASISLPTDNSAIGAFNTFANMVLQLIEAEQLITSFGTLRSIAWISLLLRSLRSASRLEAQTS